MEASLDRIQEWEERTGGFLNIKARGSSNSSSSEEGGAPF